MILSVASVSEKILKKWYKILQPILPEHPQDSTMDSFLQAKSYASHKISIWKGCFSLDAKII